MRCKGPLGNRGLQALFRISQTGEILLPHTLKRNKLRLGQPELEGIEPDCGGSG
jgi:hypothetical protein